MRTYQVTVKDGKFIVSHSFTEEEKKAIAKSIEKRTGNQVVPIAWTKETTNVAEVGFLINQCEKGLAQYEKALA